MTNNTINRKWIFNGQKSVFPRFFTSHVHLKTNFITVVNQENRLPFKKDGKFIWFTMSHLTTQNIRQSIIVHVISECCMDIFTFIYFRCSKFRFLEQFRRMLLWFCKIWNYFLLRLMFWDYVCCWISEVILELIALIYCQVLPTCMNLFISFFVVLLGIFL